MLISLMAAMDRNRGIGQSNSMPWYLPADLAYFKEITMGKPVIMGRKTHEVIGRALPGRKNIVLTRDPDYEAEGCTVVHDPDEALAAAGDVPEVMILGGADVYELFMHRADRIYLTQVQGEFDADVHFPKLDFSQWEEVRRIERPADERNPYDMTFLVLNRKILEASED